MEGCDRLTLAGLVSMRDCWPTLTAMPGSDACDLSWPSYDKHPALNSLSALVLTAL